jgi:diguanylate cyclase (GGDEF)-like protein/PAS domain S-box-containing protein
MEPSMSVSVFADLEIYRTVLEHMQTGVYMVDCDQKIQFWNDGAEIITGHLRQDVVGHSCRDFFPSQNEPGKNGVCELGGALASALRDGRPAIAEVTLRHKAGHQVTVRVRAVAIRDGAGGVIGAAESMDADPWAFYADRRHRKLATYGCLDEATGVLSSGYIHTHLREGLTTYTEHRMPCSILCIQVDGMERFAAAYGAAAVTAAVRAVAQSIESGLRPTDFVGHSGENIFLAVLTEYTGSDLNRTAERLRNTINNMKIAWWGDELPVTASFGGATVVSGDDQKSLLKRAEDALATSIAAGGDRVTIRN